MYRFPGLLLFLVTGVFLGLQGIYLAVPGVNIYTVWFFVLVVTCGCIAITTSQIRKGVFWGVLLWLFALAVYEITMGLLQWSRWRYPFDTKSLIEGLVLILVIGIPVSWISSWLSVKNKAVYFGAALLSTAGVWVVSKVLISLYVSGAFGHGF